MGLRASGQRLAGAALVCALSACGGREKALGFWFADDACVLRPGAMDRFGEPLSTDERRVVERVARALAKKPQDRYQSAGAFSAAVSGLLTAASPPPAQSSPVLMPPVMHAARLSATAPQAVATVPEPAEIGRAHV